MNETQKQFITDRLNTEGYISRNECLRNYISRLGAHIDRLKHEGWEFEGEYVDTGYGRDYIYRVTKKPELTLFTCSAQK